MKKQIKLTEMDLHRIVEDSIYRILNEGTEDIVGQFADLLTSGFGKGTAQFIAQELAKTGQNTIETMAAIINRINGHGYGSPE